MAYYNNIDDYTFSYEANDEPITKEQVKTWLKVDGNDDNIIIEDLITAARIIIENYLNQSLIKRTVKAYINNSNGDINLPFQPFISLVSITDGDGEAIADYSLPGGAFKCIEWPQSDNIVITYKAGVSEVDKVVLTALRMQIAFMYENRGDAMDKGSIGIAPMAKSLLKNCRR